MQRGNSATFSGPQMSSKKEQRCLICDAVTTDTAFNRPIARGGFDDALNGFWCCARCSASKGTLTLTEYIVSLRGESHVRVAHYLRYHTQNAIEPYSLVIEDDCKQSTTKRSSYKWKHKMRSSKHCAYCLQTCRRLTIDHKQPLCRDGQDIKENCVAACHACNQDKGSATLVQWYTQIMDSDPCDRRLDTLKTMITKEELLLHFENTRIVAQPIDVWLGLDADTNYHVPSLQCPNAKELLQQALSRQASQLPAFNLVRGPAVRHKGHRLCMLCDAPAKTTAYNRLPEQGGSADSINAFLCCDQCNAKKGAYSLLQCLYHLQPMANHQAIVDFIDTRNRKKIEPEDLFHEYYRGMRFSSKRHSSGWKTRMRQTEHCAYCHYPNLGKLTIDHVQPLCKGGEDRRINCVAACKRCNSDKAECTLSQWHQQLLKNNPLDVRIVHVQALLDNQFKVEPAPTHSYLPFSVWPDLEGNDILCFDSSSMFTELSETLISEAQCLDNKQKQCMLK